MDMTTRVKLLAILLGTALLFSTGSAQTVLRYLQPGVDQPGQREPVERVIAKFEAENPDITVRLESVGWDDAYQKVTTDLLANNAPDVMYVGTRWIPAFAAMQGIAPLGAYASAEKLDLFPSDLIQGQKFQGELYALPIAFSTKALYYRTDLIDTPPTTWAELLDTARRITEETDGYGLGIPGAAHVGTVQQFQTFLVQAGGAFFDAEGHVSLESEAALNALEFYTGLYTEHKVTPNPIEFNREELPTLFGEGRVAMIINGPWARTIMGYEPDNDVVPYAVSVLPCDVRCSGLQGGDSLVVAAGSQNQEAAWRFIDYLTSIGPHTERILEAGLVPMLAGQSDLEEFQTPFWKPYIDMVEDGFPEAQPLAWEPFEQIINDMIQSVLLGRQNAEQALSHAAGQIREQNLEPASVR
jgi:multiple sugar transport system substrate-binding protein